MSIVSIGIPYVARSGRDIKSNPGDAKNLVIIS
jgi:hypothetical protein